ncbi:MAG: hypothetical protein AAB553_03775 [Patescibacteria group bacterium]
MLNNLKKNFTYQAVFALFVFLTIWWLLLYFSESKTGYPNYLFGVVYGTFMAGVGTIIGFKTVKYWGGIHSVMGRVVLALSLGLFAEFFGQVVFSFYNIFLGIEIPYPSLADIGFFGNIPFYFIGALFLLRASGGHLNLSSIKSQAQIVLIPACVLFFSYYLFLQNYTFDLSNSLLIFLDFGYPLGQALYVSVAILTYGLSKNSLGGIMRKKIFLVLLAFVAQYFADFNFLFQNSRGSWYNGGYGDYLYLVAYFIMTLALLQLNVKSLKKES